jgi:uncharacterized protein YndB with AHSA1/START domain
MTRSDLEHGSITRQVHIDATPQVVYEVVSSPEHIAQWWADEADVEPSPGRTGVLIWRGRATVRRDVDYVVELTVVEAVPGERFSFRWVYPDGESARATNSMLVTFTLAAEGEATLLTVTEEGMREQGWEAAVLEEYYASHADGWTRHLADLVTYVAGLSARDARP